MPIQPNTLTDEWGGTYLQLVIALLVLAAGIPGILLQLRTAPEIHRVVMRRRYDRIKVMSGMLTIYIFVALLFIWWYDSSSSAPRNSVSDWSAGLVISLMLVLTALLWLRQIELTARDRIIRRLMQEAAQEFKHGNRLMDTTVSDILDLGTAASRHDERRLVLSEIGALARTIRRMREYHGEGLEQVMEVVGMIATASHPVDEANISLAVSILLENTAGSVSNSDAVAAARTMIRILDRVSLQIDKTAVTELLQQLRTAEALAPSLLARGLFRIGLDSLNGERPDLAITCLNHLEDVLDRCADSQRATVETSLIGLVAQLWERYPVARRRLFVRPYLTHLARSITHEQHRSFADYYLDQSDFQTATFVSSLCRDLSARNAGRRKPSPGSTSVVHGGKSNNLLHALFMALTGRQ